MNPDNNQNPQQHQQGRFMDSVQPQVINPQPGNYGPTGQAPMQQVGGQGFVPQPQQNPVNVNPQQNGPIKPKKSNKTKFILVAVAGLALLGILTAIALLAAPGKKQTQEQSSTNNQTSADTQKPADAIDVGNTNNSINQDISGLNTDNDFPPTQLDDKSLNL
jgi:cytoskeletal protein RodZ